jgi:hypothetical protein
MTNPRLCPSTIAISVRCPICWKPKRSLIRRVASLWSKCMLNSVVTLNRGHWSITHRLSRRPIPRCQTSSAIGTGLGPG